MSQPNEYQGQPRPETINTVKTGSVPITNGQPPPGQHNGNQLLNYNSTGTPSSQSSRETSRDPSPTQYLHNQYRLNLNRPPMPPINGQPFANAQHMPPPGQMPPRQYFNPLEATNSVQPLPISTSTGVNLSSTHNPMNSNTQFPMNIPAPRSHSQAINSPSNPAPSLSHANQRVPVHPHAANMNQGWNNSAGLEKNINQSSSNQNNNFGIPPSIPQYSQPPTGPKITPGNMTQFAQLSKDPRVMNPGQQVNTNQEVSPSVHPPLPPQFASEYSNQQVASGSLPRVSSYTNQSIFSNKQNLASQKKYQTYDTSAYSAGVTSSVLSPSQGPIKDQPRLNLSGQYPPQQIVGPPPLPGQQMKNPVDNRQPYFGQMSNVPLDNISKRYPAYQGDLNQLNTQMGSLSVTQSGYNDLWGHETVDLLQCRAILPADKVEPPRIKLQQEFWESVNCSPDIFRCTVTKIPESNSLLQKTRLPLGILIHPFKDLNNLPLIQCSTIVRCRVCRTYINPFVYFVDGKRWKCNLCYRVNELPDEFNVDPVTKSYGDPSRRPEVKTSTIEFIAPSEYMLRPPQPAVYLFVLDVSRLAVESGYLSVVCEILSDELLKLPGDGRMQVGFLAVDSAVHFFSMPDNVSQPHELIMLDVDDVFLPCPENLIVNLKEREKLVRYLLEQLPTKFQGTHDTNSALGAGLQAAYKLMSATGGRVTVFQTCLPTIGPGALQCRENPNTRASKDVQHLNPATDFYKRLALDCSGQQITVDLFLLNSQYSDLSTLSGMCKFSGGCMYHVPLFRINKPQHKETLEKMLRRYLTRKIGFEAVMRIRCTRGLSIHTFHGNFFVRSTDLLSLPNVNPDAGFAMQVSIEENLTDVQTVCFQAALLYTSSKAERRIRVHTLCLPVSGSLTDILHSADQQSIIALVAKMAVDRSQQSSLSDARDALINVAIDVLSSYKLAQSGAPGALLAPSNLKLLPLYIVAILKSESFRIGTSTRLDDRVFSMCQMKVLPLCQLIQKIYPDLYPIHMLDDRNAKEIDGRLCPQPPRLHLSAEKLDFRGAFLMDAGDKIFIYIGKNIDPVFCSNVLGVSAYASIPEEMYELPELNTVESERLRLFIFSLQEEKPYNASIQIIRDDSHFRSLFIEHLIEDRTEAALSYYEFLQHLKTQVK